MRDYSKAARAPILNSKLKPIFQNRLEQEITCLKWVLVLINCMSVWRIRCFDSLIFANSLSNIERFKISKFLYEGETEKQRANAFLLEVVNNSEHLHQVVVNCAKLYSNNYSIIPNVIRMKIERGNSLANISYLLELSFKQLNTQQKLAIIEFLYLPEQLPLQRAENISSMILGEILSNGTILEGLVQFINGMENSPFCVQDGNLIQLRILKELYPNLKCNFRLSVLELTELFKKCFNSSLLEGLRIVKDLGIEIREYNDSELRLFLTKSMTMDIYHWLMTNGYRVSSQTYSELYTSDQLQILECVFTADSYDGWYDTILNESGIPLHEKLISFVSEPSKILFKILSDSTKNMQSKHKIITSILQRSSEISNREIEKVMPHAIEMLLTVDICSAVDMIKNSHLMYNIIQEGSIFETHNIEEFFEKLFSCECVNKQRLIQSMRDYLRDKPKQCFSHISQLLLDDSVSNKDFTILSCVSFLKKTGFESGKSDQELLLDMVKQRSCHFEIENVKIN